MPPTSAQPGIISGVANQALVYCGLLVAGIMSLLASNVLKSSPIWTSYAALGALAMALFGGLLALLSSMYAHNLARRIERAGATQSESDVASISRARWWSVTYSGVSFWAALIATIFAIAIASGFVAQQIAGRSNVLTGVRVQTVDGSSGLEIEGNIRNLSVEEGVTSCRVIVETDQLRIESSSNSRCLVQR